MGFLVGEDTEREDLERYFGALHRAQRAIDLEAERYKHFWLREMFERTHRWMESWQRVDADVAARPTYEDAVVA